MTAILALLIAIAPPGAPAAASAAPALAVANDEPATDAPGPADDDETPAELGGSRATPVAAEPDEAACGDDAPAEAASIDADSATPDTDPHLGLHLAAGFGMMLRAYDAGPQTLMLYRSTPVAAVRFEGSVAPTPSTELTLAFDRTVAMNTIVQDERVPTTSSRWEVMAARDLHVGRVAIGAVLGAGRRRFSIESSSLARSPDSDYAYGMLGARLTTPLGPRAVLRVLAAFEPVYGGRDATEMTFGPADRWGIAASASLSVPVSRHLAILLAAGYQRFAWSWTTAGERGAGGAADQYPSSTVSLAADY